MNHSVLGDRQLATLNGLIYHSEASVYPLIASLKLVISCIECSKNAIFTRVRVHTLSPDPASTSSESMVVVAVCKYRKPIKTGECITSAITRSTAKLAWVGPLPTRTCFLVAFQV